jgi:hypothetical protein
MERLLKGCGLHLIWMMSVTQQKTAEKGMRHPFLNLLCT